jgi:hypothetical protein
MGFYTDLEAGHLTETLANYETCPFSRRKIIQMSDIRPGRGELFLEAHEML